MEPCECGPGCYLKQNRKSREFFRSEKDRKILSRCFSKQVEKKFRPSEIAWIFTSLLFSDVISRNSRKKQF